ncbi:hypothetical protein CRE_08445 [Caenorhabditis remanei]|uniref:Uncharacterized protein n=1 Tax=Caenorhabditis remanei TaxID=31234 RepID=E3N018_CAERE|nr:hypothetical protein CRE_08445 [Caenorhabditis remanei]
MTMNSGNSKKITFDTMEKSMKEFIEYGVTDALEGNMLIFKRGEHALEGLWACVLKKRFSPRKWRELWVHSVMTAALIDDYLF